MFSDASRTMHVRWGRARSAVFALGASCALSALACSAASQEVEPRPDAPSVDAGAWEAARDTTPPAPEPAFDPALAARLTAVLDGFVAQSRAPGIAAAVVLRDGRIWQGVAGLARTSPPTPLRLGDATRVGSITKVATSIVVQQLAAEHVLSLTDSLARWIPEFPNAASFSLLDLLMHTTGLTDYLYAPAIQSSESQPHTAAQLLEAAAQVQPQGTPAKGTYRYSNTNYLLLGVVVERATGQSWASAVRTRVLDRAAMTESFVAEWEAGEVVHGYAPNGTDVTGTVHPTVAYAAGCLASTARDVVRLSRALFGGRLLPPSALDTMLVEHRALVAPGQWYGLGIFVEDAKPYGTLYGHTGGIRGYSTDMQTVDGLGITVGITLNVEDAEALAAARKALWIELLPADVRGSVVVW